VTERDRIELRGLRFMALVGALPEEVDRVQPLELDLDVEANLAVAGVSDELADTIDYGALCALAERTVVGGGHVRLLEAVADQVARAVLEADVRITRVTVAVRKLRPPVPQDLATSGVRVTRSR
jgi:dihydroneopterin aldolase